MLYGYSKSLFNLKAFGVICPGTRNVYVYDVTIKLLYVVFRKEINRVGFSMQFMSLICLLFFTPRKSINNSFLLPYLWYLLKEDL